jgi:hypothetical protein
LKRVKNIVECSVKIKLPTLPKCRAERNSPYSGETQIPEISEKVALRCSKYSRSELLFPDFQRSLPIFLTIYVFCYKREPNSISTKGGDEVRGKLIYIFRGWLEKKDIEPIYTEQ